MLYLQNLSSIIIYTALCFLYAIIPNYTKSVESQSDDGYKPLAYFADAKMSPELDVINLELDVNIVQEVESNVTVNACLVDSSGKTVDSQTISYRTFSNDVDYQIMGFRPSTEDFYSIVITVYPEDGITVDSRVINVLWPPGTGAYFRKYEAHTSDEGIEFAFDVDLEYDITYPVEVEAILYSREGDVIAYNYATYLTTCLLDDEHKIMLMPKTLSHDGCYGELIVCVNDLPASHGYIVNIPSY